MATPTGSRGPRGSPANDTDRPAGGSPASGGPVKENALRLFVPLTKYDAERNIATGVIAAEELDKAGEILDFEKSLPHFQAWSDLFAKATDGKSVGNLRVMHTNKVAGRGLEFVPVPEKKRFEMSFHVVDRDEQEKCATGCYTGFSIGGDYVDRWDDAAVKFADRPAKRYEAKPIEVSLVDNPCIPSAQFEYHRAAGEEPELRKFKAAERHEKVAGLEAALARLADLGKGAAPELMAATAAEALAGLDEVKAVMQQVLSRYSLLPLDRSTPELHSMLDALSRMDMAAYTAQQIRADALAQQLEDEEKRRVNAAGGGDDGGSGGGGGGGESGGGGSGGRGGGAIVNQSAEPGELKKDAAASDSSPSTEDEKQEQTPEPEKTPEASKDPAPAAATDTPQKSEPIVELVKGVLSAMKTQTQQTEAIAASLAGLKDGVEKAAISAASDAVKKATEAHRVQLEALEKRLETVEGTPAAIGSPVKRADKTLGTPDDTSGGSPLDVAGAETFLKNLQGKISAEAYRVVALQMATASMPRR